MNIAFLSYYSGTNYRGVERYVHELANKLCNSNHVTVYQHGPKLPQAKYDIGLLSNAKSIPKFISKPDVIISTNGRLQSAAARLWSRLNNVKLIIPGQSGPGIDDRLNLFTFPDIFVALTHTQAIWAKNANPFVQVCEIPNGVDVDKFIPKKSRPKNKFLLVAALTPAKRIDLAIKAVAKIPNSQLTLIGSGPEKDKLLSLGKKLLPNRLEIKSVKPEDMPQVYQDASVFLYPTSPFESFGIVLLEAMSANLPIVATDDPIRREIIGSAGLYIDPEDIDSFSHKIMSADSYDWKFIPRDQAQKFSWTVISQKYETMLSDLINK